MACLSIATLGVVNSPKMLLSTWIRMPSMGGAPVASDGGYFHGIACFGASPATFSSPFDHQQSRIGFAREAGHARFTFNLISSEFDLNGNYAQVGTFSGGENFGPAQTTHLYDEWHHVLFSCNLSQISRRRDFGAVQNVYHWQNIGSGNWDGVTQFLCPQTELYTEGTGDYVSGPYFCTNTTIPPYPGFFWNYVVLHDPVTFSNFFELIYGKIVDVVIDGQVVWFQNQPIAAPRNQVEGHPNCGTWPGSDPNGRDPVPPLPMNINALEFGVPDRASFVGPNYNSTTEYYDYQVWFNTYADPTNPAVISKFITTNGTPQPTSVAAAAFGTPHILYEGGVNTFSTNNGSGGTASKTGTITPFSPLPFLPS